MPKAEQEMIAIEPATMTVPTMDRPSIAFAWFLDNITVEVDVENWNSAQVVCALCRGIILEVDEGSEMSLRVILNTALAHGC